MENTHRSIDQEVIKADVIRPDVYYRFIFACQWLGY